MTKIPQEEIFELNTKNVPLLIFLATVMGYAIAFAFQYGYLKYFNVSYLFIDISTSWIVISLGALLYTLFISDYLITFYRTFLSYLNLEKTTHRKAYLVISTFTKSIVPISLFFYAIDAP